MKNTGGGLVLIDRHETSSLENSRDEVRRGTHGLKFVRDGMGNSGNSYMLVSVVSEELEVRSPPENEGYKDLKSMGTFAIRG